MTFQDRLKELRGTTSQRQCAKNLGVSAQVYSKWETGSTPKTDILIHIADYYNVTLDYLLGRTDYKSIEFQNTTIKTGLSENAIKGLQQLQTVSKGQSIKLVDVLNRLLERELDPDVQKHVLEMLEDASNGCYLYEIFSDTANNNRDLISLSALLIFVAYNAKAAAAKRHENYVELQNQLNALSAQAPTISKSAIIQHFNDSLKFIESVDEYISEDKISKKLLLRLRSSYSGSTFLKYAVNNESPRIPARISGWHQPRSMSNSNSIDKPKHKRKSPKKRNSK